MKSQPQNPEFRINPKNFHPCFSHGSIHNQLFFLDLQHLSLTYYKIKFWMLCNVATVRSIELLAKLELEDLNLTLREREKALLVWECGAF